MERIESGAAGGVIVYDLERFARQLRDGERLVTAAERGLLVLDSEGTYDLRKPGDKKNFRNAIVAAEYYSDLLRVKVRRGKKAKALSGKVDMRRSFGFESDGVTVSQDEAGVIRDCARRLLAGETQDSLIKELNNTGIPSVRGAQWGRTTFRQIMLRPRNVGLIAHNGEIVPGVRLPGEPIIDQLTHDRICAMFAARKPGRPPSGRYMLTGIATCEGCGSGLSGRPITGTPRKEYWCRYCRRTFVDVKRLEDWVSDFVLRTLSDPAHAEATDRAAAEYEAARSALLSEAADIGATLDMLTEKLAPPVRMPRERYNRAARPLEQRLAEIDQELAGLVAEEPIPAMVRTIPVRDQQYLGWLEAWVDGTVAERRAMVIRALAGHRIVVGPGGAAKFDPDRVTIA
jgi:hypothetical protein